MKKKNILKKRGAGILMPVSSLPSNYGIGTFGQAAYDFADDLYSAGQSYWQVLPLGPTSFGDSPYQSFSAFAGNPYFIDLDILIKEGLLKREEAIADWGSDPANVDYALIYENRFKVLKKAFSRSFFVKEPLFDDFIKDTKYWLHDYCVFMALKNYFRGESWQEWPDEYKFRNKKAMKKIEEKLSDDILFWAFCQYEFYKQYKALKTYVNNREIYIIGDIPIYTALDSADVWSKPELFQLDHDLNPKRVAGVPPDMFSATGQLWGNPLYDWDKMKKDKFKWWKERIKCSARLYDVIRIDHFIGIVNYYSIPAEDSDARNGKWVEGPGKALTDIISEAAGDSKIIAEDLGEVSYPVRKLIKKTGWPGMKIMEFAFDDNKKNPYLPQNFTSTNFVVYGGTHDNETMAGYLKGLDDDKLSYIKKYLGLDKDADTLSIIEAIVRLSFMSVANTCIYQMQDYLCLDNSARMNEPSTIGTNWRFRMTEKHIPEDIRKKIRKFTKMYNRMP